MTLSDPSPEAGILCSQTTQNSGPEDGRDIVTVVHKEVTYCSPSTCSGKQKKNSSTSQAQFCSENTPATIEAEQILLAFGSWQTTTLRQISLAISTEFAKCQSHS